MWAETAVWQKSSGLVGVAAVALVVALVGISHRSARVDELGGVDWGAETSKIENALENIEGKLSTSFSSPPSSKLVGDGTAAKPLRTMPGHEWSAGDQMHYDSNMRYAFGEEGTKKIDGMKLPPSFMPIDDPGMQQQYAHNLVEVLRNLKSGYLEEMLKWAEKGPTAENSYIAPIVEGIEAPLIKDLDAEAHERVKKTVADIGQRKNLKPHQMKEMRARLLVPLLLRIRARVHHQVELYTVKMLRRVILDGAVPNKDGTDHMSTMGIAAPDSSSGPKRASDDMQMEYQLRDIDTLYSKGIISERDYQAEKAKVLSDWLGLAIKQIGGKKPARIALEDFLWPPVMTQDGCKCLLPFEYDVDQLKNKTITYDECTDINSPGTAWCAIDPEDTHCMANLKGFPSTDPKAVMGDDGYGWSRWDKCFKQPKTMPEGQLPSPVPKVVTDKGCTCILPFEFYPDELGGKQKVVMTHCTKMLGQDADWCAVEGHCGMTGLPGKFHGDKRLSWTNWDKCVGEPAGFLEPVYNPTPTRQGCQCKRTWHYESLYLQGTQVQYTGCTDIESPGTAWCAVEGDDCGDDTSDPKGGYGKGKYGWTKWDVCIPQPTAVMADLEEHILPDPAPYVRTEHGCQCQLPWKVALPETNNHVETFYTCQRFGMHAAWCPTVGNCGIKSDIPLANNGVGGFGWTHWDKCIGEPAGYLAPPKPKIYTRDGCVCKQPWPYRPQELGLQEFVYTGCTDMASPNDAWCAVDPIESPNCGTSSSDSSAGLGAGKYGWIKWDYCMDQNPSHAMGVVPYPAESVRTLQGCTCKIPYQITPPALGGQDILFSHCNRFDQDGSGLSSFYWCPVNEQECGYVGKDGQWDKCVGVPSGYLEPTAVKTVQGCECLLPFEYEPPVLAGQEGPKRFVYTSPTDIRTAHGGAWCATVGQCGHTSSDAKAHFGPGGYGWTNWDVVVDQPPVRPLLSGDDAGKDQHELPEEMQQVRTQHGCKCKLPWTYAPAYTCGVSEDDEGTCVGKGGYMMSGWCVVCKDMHYTQCARVDQDSAWCAVEGECGVVSTGLILSC